MSTSSSPKTTSIALKGLGLVLAACAIFAVKNVGKITRHAARHGDDMVKHVDQLPNPNKVHTGGDPEPFNTTGVLFAGKATGHGAVRLLTQGADEPAEQPAQTFQYEYESAPWHAEDLPEHLVHPAASFPHDVLEAWSDFKPIQ
jgi:hypothetical protein